MKYFPIIISLLVSFVLSTSLLAQEKQENKNSIYIMSYNVQNLFDAVNDCNKNDEEFTPTGSCKWDREKIEIKLKKAEKVIRSNGKIPDILGLVEIENENILYQLAKRLDYDEMFITRSPDRRGIDVAIIYKKSSVLKAISRDEHKMVGPFFEASPSRNILELTFLIGDKTKNSKLTIFVNHWPSPRSGSPNEAQERVNARIATALQLQKIINRKLNQDNTLHILAMGDFNVLEDDNPHAFKNVLCSQKDATNPLADVHSLFMMSNVPKQIKYQQPLGTYFYYSEMKFNQLDRFLISQNLIDQQGLECDYTTYRIYSPEFIRTFAKYNEKTWQGPHAGSTIKGVPFRYNHKTKDEAKAGFSDHFPIIVEFKLY